MKEEIRIIRVIAIVMFALQAAVLVVMAVVIR